MIHTKTIIQKNTVKNQLPSHRLMLTYWEIFAKKSRDSKFLTRKEEKHLHSNLFQTLRKSYSNSLIISSLQNFSTNYSKLKIIWFSYQWGNDFESTKIVSMKYFSKKITKWINCLIIWKMSICLQVWSPNN